MAEDGKYRRVDIGFAAGAVLTLRVQETEYSGLRGALSDDRSARWHQLEAEDADVTLDLSQVIYVRVDTERGRVGF
jgi:hypothetical protein